MAILRTAVLLTVMLGDCLRGSAQAPARPGLSPALERASRTRLGPVEADMRHVRYHVDDRVELQIDYLRGALIPTTKDPPWFDDPESFTLAIDTGRVAITPASLTALLNRYVFNYKGT